MFDEELPKKTSSDFPRNLENMSVSELEEYVQELEREIARTHVDIEKKKASQAAAANIFKN